MAPVPVLEFIGACSGRPGKKLVAHADTEHGPFRFHRFSQMRHGLVAEFRVSGPVGNKKTVILHAGKIIIPWYSHYLDPPFHEASEDIMLDSAIDEDHSLLSRPVFSYFRTAHLGNLVLKVRVIDGEILIHPVRDDHSKH